MIKELRKNQLSYGEIGEICFSGPAVMDGYLNNPEETDKVLKIHSDGQKWVHTKDIGYMDEVTIVFRTLNMLEKK